VKCAFAALLVCVSAFPARAQYQWPYQPWPGFEQPRPQPRQHPRLRAKPEIRYQTKTVTVVKRESWRGMSQDRAREWLRDQTQEFCRKYTDDAVCQRPAKEQ
jgi:hypothetical protein